MTLTCFSSGFAGAAANMSCQRQTTRQNWTSVVVTVRYLAGELNVANENAMEFLLSATGIAPSAPLASLVNQLDNIISANITEQGFLYVGKGVITDALLCIGFGPLLP